jgi:transcriptional regulator with XRE-family HTH domain
LAPQYGHLAAQIKAARLRKGLSQEQAAALVGTSRFHWIRWEQGLHKPTEYAARLVEVLGLPEDVFGDDEDDLDETDPVAALFGAFLRIVDRRVEERLSAVRS